jgi:hypothetical protein
VVESTALEMRHTRKGIAGSNPALSARIAPPFVLPAVDFAAEVVSCCLLQSRGSI